jgi:hypothetical protein
MAKTRTKTEHFSLVGITSKRSFLKTEVDFSAIANGAFTAGGTYDDVTHILRFPNGTLDFRTKEGPIKTTGAGCGLLKESSSDTYVIEHGTGAYKGIKGSGKAIGKVTSVFPMTNGTCSKKPSQVQIIITGSGPVSLP